MHLLDEVLEKLAQGKPLEPNYNDHALHGNYVGFRECHIQSCFSKSKMSCLIYYSLGVDLLARVTIT